MFTSDHILEEHRRVNEIYRPPKYKPNPEHIKALERSIKKSSMSIIMFTPEEEAVFFFQKWYKLVRGFSCHGMRDVAYSCAIEEVMGLLTEHSLLSVKDNERSSHLEKTLEVLKHTAK